jgi:hypothetical protein
LSRFPFWTGLTACKRILEDLLKAEELETVKE